jgi:hypothetical protein
VEVAPPKRHVTGDLQTSSNSGATATQSELDRQEAVVVRAILGYRMTSLVLRRLPSVQHRLAPHAASDACLGGVGEGHSFA